MSRKLRRHEDHLKDVASAHGTTRAPQRESQAPPELEALRAPRSLHTELILEILSWLPVKYLLRLRCVCKSWKSEISEPHFVKKHLDRSITDPSFSHHRLVPLLPRNGDHVRVSCPLQSFLKNPPNLEEDVSSPFNHSEKIVGSCNGLLCLVDIDINRLFLLNPATRLESEKSPPLRREEAKKLIPGLPRFGFGYDNVTNKYKVVASFSNHGGPTIAKVHTFGEDSWREFENFPYFINSGGSFLNGTLNWLAEYKVLGIPVLNDLIVSFDLRKERCKEILLPKVHKYAGTLSLGVLRDSLSLSYIYMQMDRIFFVVWAMKEYGVGKSWTKLLNISGLGIFNLLPFPKQALFMSENGEFLFEDILGHIFLYNPSDKTYNRTGILSSESGLQLYVEILVSPCF